MTKENKRWIVTRQFRNEGEKVVLKTNKKESAEEFIKYTKKKRSKALYRLREIM